MQRHQLPDKLPTVAVVCVTQNRCGPLLKLLYQINQLNYPPELLDIFLVDSGSTDSTVDCVKKQFPGVNLVTTSKNLGIAAGFNMAIQAALKSDCQYKYLWLLDSDVQIEANTLLPLVEVAESDRRIAVAGSVVYEPDRPDQLITAGFTVDWNNCNVAFNVPGEARRNEVFEVELIPACSSLTRAELYEQQGLWDERLWLYWGDTEWCMRSIRNGYRVCCIGKSKVWHRNWSKIKPDYYFPRALHDRVRSALLFNLCYNPEGSTVGLRKFILKCSMKAAFENLTVRPNFSRAYYEGMLDFMRADFGGKDFSSWEEGLGLFEIGQLAQNLRHQICEEPRIVLNQISEPTLKAKIKEAFESDFSGVTWDEIPSRKDLEDRTGPIGIREYLCFQIPQFISRLLCFSGNPDVIVSPIAIPCLYNGVGASYVVFVNDSGHCCIRKNRRFRVLRAFLSGLLKALRLRFVDLPRALRKSLVPIEAVQVKDSEALLKTPVL
ncbi:MAG: glycosyltransferase family 2 protein [Planctomycetota bacterium]